MALNQEVREGAMITNESKAVVVVLTYLFFIVVFNYPHTSTLVPSK